MFADIPRYSQAQLPNPTVHPIVTGSFFLISGREHGTLHPVEPQRGRIVLAPALPLQYAGGTRTFENA
jgi:hypothetical protein